MLFNSKVFVAFLVVVLLVYYRLGKEGKLWFLLGMSYIFYGFWDPRLCTLILLSTLVDYVCALQIEAAGDDLARRKRWLWVSLVSNLGALGFFKYYNFFVESLVFSAGLVGLDLEASRWTLSLILPVGISFYTFQTLSYTIDVYQGRFRADRSLRDFALYVAFFPQLVAGPVERATHLLPQYKREVRITRRQVEEGTFRILLGFVKKVVIGDRIALWIAPHFARPVDDPSVALMAIVLFTLQIYVDFSAYSDIAIGLGRLLGYDIRENFDLPFVVPSIPERWRRWHLSMGHWFRDYVYFPLGGNRHGPWRTQLNVFTVMFLSGLWHGASYNFVIWGVLNGGTMVGHAALRPVREVLHRATAWSPVTRWAWYYLACAITMLNISLINIFFRSDTWEVAKSYVRVLFTTSPLVTVGGIAGGDWPDHFGVGFDFFWLVVAVHEAQRWFHLKEWVLARRWAWAAVCLGMYVVVLVFGIKGPQFIYFQF